MRALIGRKYEAGVRELHRLLWRAFTTQQDPLLSSGAGVAGHAPTAAGTAEIAGPADLSPGQIQRCLDEHNGAIEPTWRALGLSSRFALRRLIKRHDLEVRRRPRRGG